MSDSIPQGMIASPFFEDKATYWLAENELAFVRQNLFPVADGHCLILPKRIVASPTELTDDEMLAIFALMKSEKAKLAQQGITDVMWGWNDGINAGQSVAHVHLHLIPRQQGDVEKPRGGIVNIFANIDSYYDEKQADEKIATTTNEILDSLISDLTQANASQASLTKRANSVLIPIADRMIAQNDNESLQILIGRLPACATRMTLAGKLQLLLETIS